MKKIFLIIALVGCLAAAPAYAREPNDPLAKDSQWYLRQISAQSAWDITVGNRDVVIAVIDSGVDIDHPDLENKIWSNSGETAGDGIDNDGNGFIDDVHGWDFVGNDNDPHPDNDHGLYVDAINHGTAVSGIIAAETNNSQGIAGINWRAQIMPVRVLDGLGAGNERDAASGVRYAVEQGANVINMSFASYTFDANFERAIRDAYRQGVVIVAAVGNEDGGGVDMNDTPIYPVCMGTPLEDWVLGVAASDEDDAKADFSNYGSDCTDVTAPGTGVYSSVEYRPKDPTFGEAYNGPYEGTSVAAPQVTAVAALIKGGFPELTVEQIQTVIKLSVDPLNVRGTKYAGQMGAGRLNAERALIMGRELEVAWAEQQMLAATPTPTPTPTPTLTLTQ